jgi:hypothetical protein
MNIINLKRYPKFWQDFTDKIHAVGMSNQPILVNKFDTLVREWYGYDVIGEPHRIVTEVTMGDQDLTVFLLRWS